MFASDRDLLVLEPGLFLEVVWPGQTLYEGSFGVISGTRDQLTVTGGAFDDQGVGAGHVVVVDGVAVEVTALVGPSVLNVSVLRERADGATVPLSFGGSNLGVRVTTFRQQIAHVHDSILSVLGISESGAAEGVVDEDAVVNAGEFVLAETLGALSLVYASASALVDASSVTWAKATMYRQRFMRERDRLVAEIDVDGDGVAGATRRTNTGRLSRG